MSGFPSKSGGGSGTISDITSSGGTITITAPTGPTTNLEDTNPAPAAATTVTGPDAFGASAAVGTGTHYARNDHGHGLPAAPADLPLTGGTMSGAIAMGTHAVTGLTQTNYTVATPSVSGGAVTVLATSRISNFTVSATTAITMSTSGAVDGMMVMVRILDGGTPETLSWVNTENSTVSVPTTSNGSTTLPLTVGFQYNGSTSLWRCIASA